MPKTRNPQSNRFAVRGSEFNFKENKPSKKKRKVPLGIKIRISLADVKFMIGTAFIIMGTFFLLIFSSFFIKVDQIKIKKDDPYTNAVVQDIVPTNTHINERLLYRHIYKYTTPSGEEFINADEFYRGEMQKGDTIVIQYAQKSPNVSVIPGQEDNSVPAWVFLFLLIFPAIGAMLVISSLTKIRRIISIIEYGEAAQGKLSGKEPTNASVNNQTVYRFFFKYTAHDGKEYTATGETYKTYRLTDEPEELIIYNPNDPTQAFPVDAYSNYIRKFILKN
ncbi:MAG: hypothetical protein U9N85_11665 [Bacteroidota bacterium]|nr:hypothetical protein [Bacteroidota bacterium]